MNNYDIILIITGVISAMLVAIVYLINTNSLINKKISTEEIMETLNLRYINKLIKIVDKYGDSIVRDYNEYYGYILEYDTFILKINKVDLNYVANFSINDIHIDLNEITNTYIYDLFNNKYNKSLYIESTNMVNKFFND